MKVLKILTYNWNIAISALVVVLLLARFNGRVINHRHNGH